MGLDCFYFIDHYSKIYFMCTSKGYQRLNYIIVIILMLHIHVVGGNSVLEVWCQQVQVSSHLKKSLENACRVNGGSFLELGSCQFQFSLSSLSTFLVMFQTHTFLQELLQQPYSIESLNRFWYFSTFLVYLGSTLVLSSSLLSL